MSNEKQDSIEINEEVAKIVLEVLVNQSEPISLEKINDLKSDKTLNITEKDLFWLGFTDIELLTKIKSEDGDFYLITNKGKDWLGKILYNGNWGREYFLFERIEKLDELLGITIQDKINGIHCFYDGNDFGLLTLNVDNKPPQYIIDSLFRNMFFQHHDINGKKMNIITIKGYKFLEKNKPDVDTNWGEQGYLNLLRKILYEGQYRKPEKEEGRNELFLEILRYDLTDYKLPLFTSKFVYVKGAAREMEWFLTGDQNTNYLDKHNVSIWDEWKNEDDVVGPLYGFQWRHWQIDPNVRFAYKNGEVEIDQISDVINSLKDRPEARSHMVTAWRPDHLKLMSIKPCHILLQFYRIGDVINLAMYQRSH